MKKISAVMIIVILCLSMFEVLALKVRAQQTVDWWPMFHHDLTRTGYSTSAAPNTNQTLWSYTSGASVYSSAAVVDGVVYVGSDDGNVYALNNSTGASVWSYTTGNSVESSPAVADGMVFVGSDDNSVYALNAATGASVWSYPTGGPVESSPAVAGGVVYVGSVDDKVYAFSVSGSGGGLPAIEMYAIIAIVVIVIVATVAAVYLVVRRRRPGESAGQGMHM